MSTVLCGAGLLIFLLAQVCAVFRAPLSQSVEKGTPNRCAFCISCAAQPPRYALFMASLSSSSAPVPSVTMRPVSST